MANQIFAASFIKVERARRFITELATEQDRYAKSSPCRGRIVMQDGEPVFALECDGCGLMPGAIAGDAFHNMRTALDLMASSLATLNKRSCKDVYFPISASEESLAGAIESKHFEKCGPDAVALLKTLRPYRGGNDDLRAIHDLDIADKHTAMIPTGSAQRVAFHGTYDLDDPVSGTVTTTVDDVCFTFPPGGAFAGQPMLATLEGCVEIIESILEAFSRLVELRAAAESAAPSAE